MRYWLGKKKKDLYSGSRYKVADTVWGGICTFITVHTHSYLHKDPFLHDFSIFSSPPPQSTTKVVATSCMILRILYFSFFICFRLYLRRWYSVSILNSCTVRSPLLWIYCSVTPAIHSWYFGASVWILLYLLLIKYLLHKASGLVWDMKSQSFVKSHISTTTPTWLCSQKCTLKLVTSFISRWASSAKVKTTKTQSKCSGNQGKEWNQLYLQQLG